MLRVTRAAAGASGGMADTLDLGSSAARRRSSTLLSPTRQKKRRDSVFSADKTELSNGVPHSLALIPELAWRLPA